MSINPFNQQLKAFARDVLQDFPEGMPDDFALFELAVEHGLLIGAQIVAPCEAGPESCTCYADNGPGLATCYRRHPALVAENEQDDG